MNTNKQIRRVAVIGYNRIPFVRQNTAYIGQSNQDMLVATINGLVEKYSLQGELLGEVAGGAVIKSAKEASLIRESVMHTKLHPNTPGCDLQQACDTGIESAVYIGNKIALGQIESGIACGVDSTSFVPIEVSNNLRNILLAASRAKTTGDRIKQFLKIRLKDFAPSPPANIEPETGLSMGGHTEYTAKYYGISREDQDRFAYESHMKYAAAIDEGFLADMITPFAGIAADNNLRRDSTIEKLGKLKPAFDKVNGSLTAGNSTPLSDGAAAILLASEEWAAAHKLPVLAYITFAEVAAIEYVQAKHNLLLAPVNAAANMLQKADMKLTDFDFYEIHEAFAAQVLATLKIWESDELSRQFGLPGALGKIDRSKLNVKGSSLAAAHPFAATGGRIIATMAKLLNQKGSGKGFISICAARGQGVTMIMEK